MLDSMRDMADAYLDIETAFDGSLTVVGILREDRGLLQLVGRRIAAGPIVDFLNDIGTLFTYNGHSFDLPRIKNELGLDLRSLFSCRDLMHDCHRHRLKGGLKKVEIKLGIPRRTEGVAGFDAMKLWAMYLDRDDEEALQLLLEYNREDVENLVEVRRRLELLD